MDKEDITNLVISSLDEVLREQEKENEVQIDSLNESTYLIGRRAVLDSLGLVTLVVNIEQRLGDDYGIYVTIADERALSQEKSPFKTVESLSEYISLLIEEQKHNG